MLPLLGLSFALPFKDPVMVYALAMIIILLAPLVSGRLKIPSIIVLIVAGALVGPNAAGLLARDATIVLLGTVGLQYLMFLAGLEVDINEFNKSRAKSLVFGLLTFAFPQSVGIAAGLALDFSMSSAVLFGSIFASHTLLAYPVATRLKINKIESVVMAVGGTIITDVLALLVLAVVVGAQKGALNAAFWTKLGVSMAIYAGFVMLVVPRIGRWFFSRTEAEAQTQFIFVIATLFTCAFLAEVAGVEAIIGAFLSGLALNRLIPHQGTLMNRINFVGEAVFIPFFLLSVGMLVDIKVIATNPKVWVVAGVMCAVVTSMKLLAAKIAQWVLKMTPEDGWVVFGLSVPQAAATLAATIVGFNIGLFDEATVNGSIAMILVTCIIGPLTVQRYGSKIAERMRSAGPEVGRNQRILIPLSRAEQVAPLMEVALLLRHEESHEPLFPMTIVDEGAENLEAALAAGEKVLEETVYQGAAADVHVMPMTQTALSAARGIVRGAIERRTTDVVVAWNGEARQAGVVLGPTLDTLLRELQAQLVVCNIRHALNTTSRVVLVLPPGVLALPGFAHTGSTVKKLAQQVGAMITVLALQREEVRAREALAALRPEVTTTVIGFSDWEQLLAAISERTDVNDLSVLVLPRPDQEAWSGEVAALPARLPELVQRSMILCFPSLRDEGSTEQRRVDEAMRAEHLLLELGEPGLDAAFRSLLYRDLELIGLSTEELRRRLFVEQAPRLLANQQIMLVEGRIDGLEEQTIYVARQLRGFIWDDERVRPRLLCVVLSPKTVDAKLHERLCEELRLAVETPGLLERLLRAPDARAFLRAFFPEDPV